MCYLTMASKIAAYKIWSIAWSFGWQEVPGLV
jgi:hypothetical protein